MNALPANLPALGVDGVFAARLAIRTDPHLAGFLDRGRYLAGDAAYSRFRVDDERQIAATGVKCINALDVLRCSLVGC